MSSRLGGPSAAFVLCCALLVPALSFAQTLQLLTTAGGLHRFDFAARVASAGDVNGDGFTDWLGGASGFSAPGGLFGAGRVTLYFGGAVPDSVPDLALTGTQADGAFGAAVAGVNDVNGDGYGDFAVGAPGDPTNGVQAGRVFVYFGGPGLDTTPDLVLATSDAVDLFGSAVAGAGDVNGDGFADIVVGAPVAGVSSPREGRAYVYFGGAHPDAAPDVVFGGEGEWELGSCVAGAGDVNGDGYADILVGAPGSGVEGDFGGRAFVYLGGAAMDAVADLSLLGSGSEWLGSSVAGAGDVDGDGYADFLVGAIWNGAGGSQAGRVYLHRGGASLDGVPDLVLDGSVSEMFGTSVSGLGDIDGDGFADFAVGAPGPRFGALAGRVAIYRGAATLDGVADIVLNGGEAGDGFGVSVAAAGSVNGGGRGVLVGALDAAGAEIGAGRAYVYGQLAATAAVPPPVAPDGAPAFSVRCAGTARDGSVRLRVTVPQTARVRVVVLDSAGRQVRELASRLLSAGASTVVWDGRDRAGAAAPSGVYWLRASDGTRAVTVRAARLR